MQQGVPFYVVRVLLCYQNAQSLPLESAGCGVRIRLLLTPERL